MKFSKALKKLRKNRAVCREGWGGRRINLIMGTDGHQTLLGDGTGQYLRMFDGLHEVYPWVPQGDDLFANDWQLSNPYPDEEGK